MVEKRIEEPRNAKKKVALEKAEEKSQLGRPTNR
jgi:hypothetical protein